METIQKPEIREIMEKLAKLQEDVEYIKENMVDVDSVMTEDDYEAIEKARKEKKDGRLISHEQLKKELGL